MAELHAEGHGLGVDAVGAADAESVLELEGALLARLAQALDVLDDDVAGLGDLVGKRGVAQIGGGHAVVHPTARLVTALGDVGVDVVGHARGEGDDIVVGHLLDLVDLLHGEVGVVADPLGLFPRDARLAQLGLSLAGQNLDFLPDGELVLEFPDTAHFRTGVATNHVRFLSSRLRDRPRGPLQCSVRRVPKTAAASGAFPPNRPFPQP